MLPQNFEILRRGVYTERSERVPQDDKEKVNMMIRNGQGKSKHDDKKWKTESCDRCHSERSEESPLFYVFQRSEES